MMNQKIQGSRTSPTVNPPPCPKLFDTSFSTRIETTRKARLPTDGTISRRRNHAQFFGFPATRSSTMNW
jgi:hypothetical protein